MSAQESRQELRILELAREYVARGWTQGRLARDAQGEAVSVGSEAAVCWCLGGALLRAHRDVSGATYWHVPPALRAHLDRCLPPAMRAHVDSLAQVAAINDSIGMTQEKVLALLDEMLEEAAEYPVPSAIWEAGVP